MARKQKTIDLMVVENIASINMDRGGGQTHGLPSLTSAIAKRSVDLDQVRESLDKCMDQVNDVLKTAGKKIADGWKIDELKFSLAVSGEGSVGIATVGVEATFEITLKPK